MIIQFSVFSTNYIWHALDTLKVIGKTRTLTMIWIVLENAATARGYNTIWIKPRGKFDSLCSCSGVDDLT